MAKLTFDEALDRIADERQVSAKDVQARALQRKVWVAEWHLPGCLSESHAVTDSKRNAIAIALEFAQGEDGRAPRGMRTALARSGRFDSSSPIYGSCINTVSCTTLRNLL